MDVIYWARNRRSECHGYQPPCPCIENLRYGFRSAKHWRRRYV